MTQQYRLTSPNISDRARRDKRIVLEWPFELGGVTYDHLVVRRMTTGQVAEFLEEVGESGTIKARRFPMFYTDDGLPVPVEALDGMDDDDSLALSKVALDFLPRRFRGDLEAAATPPTGDAWARA